MSAARRASGRRDSFPVFRRAGRKQKRTRPGAEADRLGLSKPLEQRLELGRLLADPGRLAAMARVVLLPSREV